MKFEIKQEFIGLINDVEINNEVVFNHMGWLFDDILENFPIKDFTSEFIKTYAKEFLDIYSNLEVSLESFEIELHENIFQAEENPNKIRFSYFDEVNELIENNKAFIF